MDTPLRAAATLTAAAAAGTLIWFAGRFDHASQHDYWVSLGLVAGAGLVLGLVLRTQAVQRGSALGALAAALATLWVALATQPAHGHVTAWSHDIGIAGVVGDLGAHVSALGFGAGVVVAAAVGAVRRRPAPLPAAEPRSAAAEERAPEPEPTLQSAP